MIHYISDLVWLETAGLHLLLGEEDLPRLRLHGQRSERVRSVGASELLLGPADIYTEREVNREDWPNGIPTSPLLAFT